MPSYVCPFDWTNQGVDSAADSVERVRSSSEMAQSKHGATLERIYRTVGARGLVAFLGAPDVESVSAFFAGSGRRGERPQHHDAGFRPRRDGRDHREDRLTRGRGGPNFIRT